MTDIELELVVPHVQLPSRAEIGATSATKRPLENVRVRAITSLG